MSKLNRDHLEFDEDDVHLMKEMLKKFHDLHGGAETPDWSRNYVAYLPVFAISMLSAQQTIDQLTKQLVWLTRALVFLTLVLVLLTIALMAA